MAQVLGFSINIEGIQSVSELNKAIKETKKAFEDAKSAEERLELGEKLGKLVAEQKAVKKAQDDLNKSFQETASAARPYDALSAKLNKLRKDYKDLAVSNQASTAEGKNLLKQIQDLDKQLKDIDASVGQYQRNVGNYGGAIKEAADAMGGFGGVAGQAVQGLQAIGAASKVALGPIGALVAIFGLIVASIKAFFSSSEEGQNSLKRLQAIFNVVFNNIRDILAGVGKQFVAIFEDPMKSLQTFGEMIKQNIINRFNGLLELVPALGKAIGQLFKGEFTAAAKTAADATAKVGLGVENFTDKVNKGLTDLKNNISQINAEMQKEIQIGVQLANQQAALDKQTRATLVQNARLTQQVAELRNKFAQKDNFSNEERLKFLDQAIKLEEQILRNNESIAAQKLKIKTEQNKLSQSTKEDLDEQAQLEADLINLRTENLNKTKELQGQRIEALNAIKAEEQKAADEEKKLQEQIAKDRQKFQEDEVKFTEAAAKLNQQILEKTAATVTGLIENEFEKRRQIAQENFNNEIAQLKQTIEERKKANEERLADAKETFGAESEEAKKAQENINTETATLIDSYNQFRLEKEKQLQIDLANIKQDEVKAQDEVEKQKQALIEATQQKALESAQKQREALDKTIQDVGAYVQLGLEAIGSFIDSANQAQMQKFDEDLQKSTERQSMLEEELQNSTGLQAQYIQQQIDQELESQKKLAKEKEKLEKDAKAQKKALAIIDSIINTALAISSANTLPPPANVPAMIAAGIAGAIQTAMIAAQPLATGGVVGKPGTDIVQFAGGGKVTSRGNIKPLSNGDNVLATLKTGEVVLNQQQQNRIGYQTLKKARIPGFANGGMVGAPTTLIQSSNAMISEGMLQNQMLQDAVMSANNRIDRLQVVYTSSTDYDVRQGRSDRESIITNATF